jgi:hypothetical protein
MMCSTEVGQIVDDKFQHHAGCGRPLPRSGGLVRCCRCGGSLYFDPIDVYMVALDRKQLAKMAGSEAA